jgi:hypothetical protein
MEGVIQKLKKEDVTMQEETKVPGIIIKPQFDVRTFTPGTAVFINSIKGQDALYGFRQCCLVREASPLMLKLGYVKVEHQFKTDEDEREIPATMLQDINIKIEDVTEGRVTIDILKINAGKVGF